MFSMKNDDKLLALLNVVIDQYISSGDPIWSKFLNSLESIEYAPSTLRKYLNVLEKSWLVYQPYNSSGRIPTIEGLSMYLENYLLSQEEQQNIEVSSARKDLKHLVESLGAISDGVVVGFLRNDEYYYLWINNLLRDDMRDEFENTRYIVEFIESRSIVKHLDKKILKKNKIYYTFVQDKKWTLVVSCLYAKVNINEYESILCIVWPSRINYKKNIAILQKVIETLWN